MSRTIAIAAVLLSGCSTSTSSTSTTVGDTAGSVSAGTGGATGTGGDTGTGGVSATTGNSATTGGVVNGPPLATFIKSYSSLLCAYNFGCQADANFYYDLCKSYSAPGFGDLAAAVAAGKVGYAPDKAQQCLDTFANAPCYGTPPNQSIACTETLRGLVVPGSSCNSTADCSGSFCQGAGSGCAGTCTLFAEVGDACSAAMPCNPAEYLSCVSGTCASPRQLGSPCSVTTAACKWDPTAPLACIGKNCRPIPSQLGKPCTGGQGQCETGSYCFQKLSATSGVCTQQVALGGSCGEDADHLVNAFSARDFECGDGFQVVQCVGAGTLLDGGVHPGTCGTTQAELASCPDIPPGIDFNQPFGSGCLNGLDCFGGDGAGTCTRTGSKASCWPEPVACDPTKAWCNYNVDGGWCSTLVRPGQACTASDQCGAFNICNDAGVCDLPTGPVCSPAF